MDNITKIKNLLQYTTTSDKSYNGKNYDGGYHSLNLHGVKTKGQRQPLERLEDVPFNFRDKTILDIGSNQGGMLLSIQDKIKEGIGIDFDYRLVNAANRIRSSHKYNNLDFFVFDLNKEDFNLINNFAENEFDIIFMLSVCMWIKPWKELCVWCANNAKCCLFETNGKQYQQEEQISVLRTLYKNVTLVRGQSIDDKSQSKRKLYYCEN